MELLPGLGWNDTGVCVVHHLARYRFPTKESSIKWPKLGWYLVDQLDSFGVILFILYIEKILNRLEHFWVLVKTILG